jgi:DNA-binding NtrC family response regulator
LENFYVKILIMNIGTHEALLIIEDNLANQAALVELFSPDYRVEAYTSIAEAISAMRKRTFAVAILDLSLPDGSGENLLITLKETWPHTEVIIVTAALELETAKTCFNKGAYDYFTKPWKNDVLSRSVRRAADHYALKRKIVALEALPIKGSPPNSKAKKVEKDQVKSLLLRLITKSGLKYPALLKMLELTAVKYALAETNWNQVHSARLLGIHRGTVVKMMKRQKLPTVARPKGLKKKR